MRAANLLILALAVSAPAFAQGLYDTEVHNGAPSAPDKTISTDTHASKTPHPFAELAFDPGGGGYGVGFDMKVGVDVEEEHFILMGAGQYEMQRKTDDNAQVPHEKGHGRNLSGYTFYKMGNGWFAGVGAQWGETDNTPYTKYSWSPEVGGGKDFFNGDFSYRLQAMYFRDIEEFTTYPTPQPFLLANGTVKSLTQCTCNNGVQGLDLNAWLPSPSTNHHVFLHMNVTPAFFHDTVTQPYSPTVSTIQRSGHSAATFMSLGLVVRF